MRLLVTKKLDPGFKKKLRAAGFQLVIFPMIEISKPIDHEAALKKKIKNIGNYDWLLLTSPHAVMAVGPHLQKIPRFLKVVAVGPKTAHLVRQRGWKVVTPRESRGVRGLLAFFKHRHVKEEKVLHPCSNLAGRELISGMKKMGARVDAVVAYQTRPAKIKKMKLKKILGRQIDGILFFSPSAVDHFTTLGLHREKWLKKSRFIPFGATTAKALRRRGLRPAFTPSQSSETIFVRELKTQLSGMT